jgi:hypothetical protein
LLDVHNIPKFQNNFQHYIKGKLMPIFEDFEIQRIERGIPNYDASSPHMRIEQERSEPEIIQPNIEEGLRPSSEIENHLYFPLSEDSEPESEEDIRFMSKLQEQKAL